MSGSHRSIGQSFQPDKFQSTGSASVDEVAICGLVRPTIKPGTRCKKQAEDHANDYNQYIGTPVGTTYSTGMYAHH
jgi:hypothetical protein